MGSMPALVLGLQDLSTVRADEVKDMAILLHDGLARTYRTSICHVLPHGTTGRLGLSAFFGVISELWQFTVSKLFSPQPPVTQTVGQLLRKKHEQSVIIFIDKT
jgi:hypothetical protein